MTAIRLQDQYRRQITGALQSGTVTQSLALLEQIGQATSLPGIQGFAGVAAIILEICNSASSNRDEWKALSNDIGELAMAVAGQVEDQKENLTQDMLDYIARLCRTLEDVHGSLQALSESRTSVGWLINHTRDELTLQRLDRDIKHTLDVFSLHCSNRFEQSLKRSETSNWRGEVLGEIKEVYRALIADIKGEDAAQSVSQSHRILQGPVLPAPVKFFGRQEEVDQAVEIATGASNAVVAGRVAIIGPAGIGKSALASRVLQDQRIINTFGDRRYFIACDAADNKTDLLTAIAGPLSIQGDELQKKIMERFGQPDSKTLLVLDNFESPWEPTATRAEVETFLATLANIDNLAILITMRGAERPGRVAWTKPCLQQLKPLDLSSARHMFFSIADCPENDHNVDALLAIIDFLPLAVTLMATLAQSETTETLLQRWEDEQSTLLHRASGRRSSLDVSISISLNSPRMRAVPQALQLLKALSLLPDGIESRRVGDIFPTIQHPRKALSTLWQTSLAYNDGTGRTRILSPIRAHVISHQPSESSDMATMATYYMGLAELSSSLGGQHGLTIVKRLTPEVGNLHAIVKLVLEARSSMRSDEGLLRGAIKAAVELSKFQRYTHLGSVETLRLAVAAAGKLKDDVLRADTLFNLAWVSRSVSVASVPSDEVEKLCREALALYEGHQYPYGQAECVWLLGQLSKNTTRQNQCHVLYSTALDISLRSGNRYCQAKCLSNLSEIAFFQGDLAISEKQSQEALTIFKDLDHLTNIGLTLHLLGRIEFSKGQYDTALRYYEEALPPLEKAGAFLEVSLIHIVKGDISFARSSYAMARRDYQQALNLLVERGLQHGSRAAYAHLSLAETAAALYDDETARHYVDTAMKYFEKRQNTHGMIYSHIIYGDLALHSAPPEHEEAAVHYAIALRSSILSGFMAEHAQANLKLGVLNVSRRQLQDALPYLTIALAVSRTKSDLRGQGSVTLHLGNWYLANGDKETALACYRAAYPLCRRLDALRDMAGCLRGIGEVTGRKRAVEEAKELYTQTGDVQGTEYCRELISTK